MLTDDDIAVEFDPPDPDRMYRNYLRTCEMLEVEPVSRERAQGQMAEWSDALTAGRTGPPTTH